MSTDIFGTDIQCDNRFNKSMGYAYGPKFGPRRDKSVRVKKLPNWAEWYIELGDRFVDVAAADQKLVVAISAPTRLYAAALIAVGVFRTSYRSHRERDPKEYFEELSKLPCGTKLKYSIEGKSTTVKRLVLIEIAEFDGNLGLWSWDESTKPPTKFWVPWHRSIFLSQIPMGSDFKRPRTIKKNPEFLSVISPRIDPTEHGAQSTETCQIIGVRNHLEPEIREQIFGKYHDPPLNFIDGRTVHGGVLDDLFRCSNFLSNKADPHHTDIVSSQSDPKGIESSSTNVPVIFDGPTGFIRMNNRFRRNPWIVIFDRTSASLDPAVDAINQMYATSAGDATIPDLSPVPSNIEMTAFWLDKS